LQEALPGVAISFLPTEQTPSFFDNEVDAVVRYGCPTARDLSNHLIAVASRAWVEKHPEIR
jgi:hypothetical protein